jgi:hypothetical protein
MRHMRPGGGSSASGNLRHPAKYEKLIVET